MNASNAITRKEKEESQKRISQSRGISPEERGAFWSSRVASRHGLVGGRMRPTFEREIVAQASS
jgi:hypothetical protein